MPTVNSAGTAIHYTVEGSGPPLLMIMGLAGTIEAWRYQIADLKDHFQLIRLDNRGAGASDAPQDMSAYSMTQFAADAIAVLDDLKLEQAAVWGISMGGMIAQHVVLTYPERVSKLILGCTTAGGDCSVPPDMWVLELMMEGASKPPEVSMRDSIRFNFGPIFPQTHPHIMEEYIADGIKYRVPRHGFQGQFMSVPGHNTCQRVHTITTPTLVQHGDSDVLVPTANGLYLADHIPYAQLQLYKGAGHLYFVEQVQQVNQAVISFLQS